MTQCSSGEIDITDQKTGAKVGMSVISIIYIFYIIFIIILIVAFKKKSTGNSVSATVPTNAPVPSSYEDNFIGRFSRWFTNAPGLINSVSILSILAAGVVIGFNSLVMTPIIIAMFPVSIGDPIRIPGRNTYINPGQFFIALIGFVISLILFFFITEAINSIRRNFRFALIIIILIILFIFLTFMLAWNGMQTNELLSKPNCVPVDTKTTVFQMKNDGVSSTPSNMYSNISTGAIHVPEFGVFG